MKKCEQCNIEMIENAYIEGQHPFEVGADGRTNISLHVPTGEQGKFLGITYNKENTYPLKARFCPKCGKVETYIIFDTNEEI